MLEGFKTYIIAAVLIALALVTGADVATVSQMAAAHGPEVAAVVAAGIAVGRVIKSVFLKTGEVALEAEMAARNDANGA